MPSLKKGSVWYFIRDNISVQSAVRLFVRISTNFNPTCFLSTLALASVRKRIARQILGADVAVVKDRQPSSFSTVLPVKF